MMSETATCLDDADPIVIWAKAQYAIWDRWLGGVGKTAATRQATIWARATGNVDEALSASAKATFLAQALWARNWAERVAADPHASKIVVESAHQMYELVTACTEAKVEACTTLFAVLRSMEPERLAEPWLSAWQTAIRDGFSALPSIGGPRAAAGDACAAPSRKELMPPKTGLR
jgi:hypothetical protein